MNNLLIIGNGGHAISCIDVIEKEQKYKILGVIKKDKSIDNNKINYPSIGSDSDLKVLSKKSKNAFIAIGFIKSNKIRIDIFKRLKSLGFNLPTIISPLSYKSENSKIDEGTILMHKSFINSNARVGKNCIINTGSIIEHETIIGDHVHISTSATVNGGVNIGNNSFIGSNAIIKEGINIGENCIISAGSFVREDLKSGSTFIDKFDDK